MRKLIKLFYLSIIILTIFCIYYVFRDDKLNYVAIGDSLVEGMNPYGEIGYSYTDFLANELKNAKKLADYTKYGKSGHKTDNLIEDIENNSKLKKNLRESDLVTISIGANDILSGISIKDIDINNIYKYKDIITEVIPDIDKCIKTVRKYVKERLIIIGYYNPIPFLFNTSGPDLDRLFSYIDEEYRKIANKYDSEYISIYQLFKENSTFLPNPTDIHPNTKGYQNIANVIYSEIKTNY